jgi:hypothetical protein
VSDQAPSAPLMNGQGLAPEPVPMPAATVEDDRSTVCAAGAFTRNVTMPVSVTSGEITFAPYGARFCVFF